MKKILITGENSYIGVSLQNYLSKWPDRYQVETISLRSDAWRAESFADYDVIFHVAGIAHSDNGKLSEERARLYYAVNTDLTIEVAEKAKREGVKQFIFMSTASVYGKSSPIGERRMITRDTPEAPENVYGDSKLKAEQGILAIRDEKFYVVILRPPMIYGKGCKGNYPALASLAKKLPVFPLVDNRRSMLYIDNLTEFVRLMIDNYEYGIFWPQNAAYSNTSKLAQTIAEAHGKRLILVRGFTWVLKLLENVTFLVDKAFGSLCYDMEMSRYKQDYCVKDLVESIKETEGIL